MNKVSLISLNLNEIFIEENEVSSLLGVTKCHCWLREQLQDPCWITRMGKEAGMLPG